MGSAWAERKDDLCRDSKKFDRMGSRAGDHPGRQPHPSHTASASAGHQHNNAFLILINDPE
jgi:hypothetical protein